MEALCDPARAEQYRSFVSKGKLEARDGNLEESIRLFKQALEIHPSEKLVTNIKRLEETLASLAVDEEDGDFVDVCGSGLMLYSEMHEKLFDHQREGVAFLYSLFRDGKKGAILADDMGLGKTIQVIAFLSGMFDGEFIRSVLLVMPTTLVGNWTREFANWTPGLRVKVFHGDSKAERNRNLERIQKRYGVLITTYNMLLNNWQQLASFGREEFVWDYVILDEAHKIKSPSSKTTKAAHAIRSKNRILLTGTPVQNNLKELWALFDFACQGSLLGTAKTFKMEYENPITHARAKDATPGEKALGYKISENLMSIISPYFLRRSKEDLQKKAKAELRNPLPAQQGQSVAPAMPSLPRKNDFIVWTFLAPVQEEIYRKFLTLDHIKEVLMTTRSPLAELTVLKKLCDHPRLLSARACSQLGLEASGYNEQEGGENEADERLSMDRHTEHVSDEVLMKESGKLGFLMALLERLQSEGHRTLVFSQSRKMLDIIERILVHRRFKLMRIDGTVTHLAEREKRISMFQNNTSAVVFLLTTQVGGIGLTLTAATRVVIFDPNWNPAVDAQAVDRAYRIGQKENVVIYRLITCGTVEEKIYRRQIFKDALIRQTTGDKKNPYRYFTMQELRELFILEDTRSSSTQRQLQSLHAMQRKTDTRLDEHIAYLHSLDIFGLSDHDLMYSHETAHEDKAEDEEAHQYIEHRVQKARELVQLESQLKEQLLGNIQNTTEGMWRKEMASATHPKRNPPKSPPNHALLPPAAVEPTGTEVINLLNKEGMDSCHDCDDGDAINISSKIASLIIEDVANEQMLRDISNLSMSPSENEGRKSSSLHAIEQQHDPSSRSFDAHSPDKENCRLESNLISPWPLAQEEDDGQMLWRKPDAEISLSQEGGSNSSQILEHEQSHEASGKMGSPHALSSSSEKRCRSESLIFSGESPAEENSMRRDVQMASFRQSFDYDFDYEPPQAMTEISLDVATSPQGRAGEITEQKAATSFQPQGHRRSELGAVQNSGADERMSESENLGALLSCQVDFNLVLDCSKEDVSKKEMSLGEEIENEFQLRLDSRSSVSQSWLGEDRSEGSLEVNQSMGASDSLMDSSETSFVCKKKPSQRRIISDDEEEDGDLLVKLNHCTPREVSTSKHLEGNYMSTPKTQGPAVELCFSPIARNGERRSIASRRSIVYVVLDEVEDLAETVDYASESVNLESQPTHSHVES